MKDMKRILYLLGLIILMASFTACSSKKGIDNEEIDINQEIKDNYYPITITDKFENKIIIEEEPETVISFSPELVEIMYALNIGDKLIGRSYYCDYPEEVLEVLDMGDLFNLNIENIVESNPDLVLLSSMASLEIVETLNNQGIKVLALDADTNLDGVYEYINTLGKVFNREEKSEELSSKMKAEINQIYEKVKDLEKPTVYFVVGFGEFDSTATGDTFTGQLLELAGAVNAARDGKNWMYSIEQLVEKDPDVLICSKYNDAKSQIMLTEGYKDLTAIKGNKLFEVDENIFYRQGPRIVDAIKVLAEYLHPEAFK